MSVNFMKRLTTRARASFEQRPKRANVLTSARSNVLAVVFGLVLLLVCAGSLNSASAQHGGGGHGGGGGFGSGGHGGSGGVWGAGGRGGVGRRGGGEGGPPWGVGLWMSIGGAGRRVGGAVRWGCICASLLHTATLRP